MSSLASVQTVATVNTITVAPQINDQQFQGWYVHADGSLEAIDCPSKESLFTTASYAHCCGIGATTCSTFWTTCAGQSPVGISTETCDPSSSCQTVSIFNQLPFDNNKIYSQIICAPSDWVAFSIYRTVLTTTSTSALATVFLGASAAQSTAAQTATATGGSNTNTAPTTTNTQQSSTGGSSSSSSSQAWIAGAIIGPLAVVALLGAFAWLWQRKKKSTPTSGYPTYPPPSFSEYRSDVKYPLSNDEAPSELGGQQYGSGLYELSSTNDMRTNR